MSKVIAKGRLKFGTFHQAWNKLMCNFGDSIVDSNYADGTLHHFFRDMKGRCVYTDKSTGNTPTNQDNTLKNGNPGTKYACYDFDLIYKTNVS